MNTCLGRAFERILICLLSALTTGILLFSADAEADEVYDDFTSHGIDAVKWTISDPQHLFSQPGDSQLYFYSDNTAGAEPAPGGSLLSTRSFTTGFFSMEFSQFASSNVSPGGAGLGSFAALGLGTKSTKYARMLRGRVVSDAWGYFEANYFDGAVLHVWYVFADAVSGRLGLNYDGDTVSFFYDDGVNGWQELDISGPDTHGNIVAVTPGWSSPPPLFVAGTPGGSGVTSFAVGKVEATPHMISITPMTYCFGDVKVKRSRTVSFNVGNQGETNLSISASITGTDAGVFKIMSGGGNKTIKPGRSMSLRVAFKPTSTGSKSATLEIACNDPVTPTVDIPLSGTGQ